MEVASRLPVLSIVPAMVKPPPETSEPGPGTNGEQSVGARPYGEAQQAAIVSGVLAVLAGVAATFGPFITGEAVEGVLERARRSLPLRRRPRSSD